MPFGQLLQKHDAQFEELSASLREEWQNPHSDVDEPIIIETTDKVRPQQTPTHLYVIWNAWRDLPQRRRSEMMMDVYEEVRGRGPALNVTIAMGLTPEEADRMGIQYMRVSNPA